MLEKSLGLLFFLKKPQNHVDGEPMYVYLRITVDGSSSEISLKRTWEPARWNQEAGRALGTKEDARVLNDIIETLFHLAQAARSSLLDRKAPITAAVIKKMLNGGRHDEPTILEAFADHNERMQKLVGSEYSPRTLQRFQTSLNHTRSFIRWKFRKDDIDLRQLNFGFINDFAFWLKSEQKCNHNSTMKYLAMFKKITLHCVRAKWLQTDPFKEFKLTQKKVNKEALSKQELERLCAKKFDSDRLNQVSDMFIFSCYTGLAYIDISNLTRDKIQTGVDGKQWIFIYRQKTATPSRIPLLPIAMRLVDKYRDHPKCAASEKVFPVLSNQKTNEYLKEIATICGIKKKLTSHIARYTFATTVTLSNGVPMETVADMLGHTTLRQTQQYAKLLDHRIGDDMAALSIKLADISNAQSDPMATDAPGRQQPELKKPAFQYNYVIKNA